MGYAELVTMANAMPIAMVIFLDLSFITLSACTADIVNSVRFLKMLDELNSFEFGILLWFIAKSTGLMLLSSILFTQRSTCTCADEAGG